MWMLPVVPLIGTAQLLLEVQVTVAPLLVLVSSFKAKGAALALPMALFQLVLATTPALSLAPRLAPLPTKLMLTARAVAVETAAVKFTPVRLALEMVTL